MAEQISNINGNVFHVTVNNYLTVTILVESSPRKNKCLRKDNKMIV